MTLELTPDLGWATGWREGTPGTRPCRSTATRGVLRLGGPGGGSRHLAAVPTWAWAARQPRGFGVQTRVEMTPDLGPLGMGGAAALLSQLPEPGWELTLGA